MSRYRRSSRKEEPLEIQVPQVAARYCTAEQGHEKHVVEAGPRAGPADNHNHSDTFEELKTRRTGGAGEQNQCPTHVFGSVMGTGLLFFLENMVTGHLTALTTKQSEMTANVRELRELRELRGGLHGLLIPCTDTAALDSSSGSLALSCHTHPVYLSACRGWAGQKRQAPPLEVLQVCA